MQMLANLRLSALERSVALLDRLAARRGSPGAKAEHLLTGERGEEAAFFFLRRKEFAVVAQRWNDGPLPGDIDLIGWDGEVLCFVEVKTRTKSDTGHEAATASAAVDRHKRKTLRRLAGQYLRHLPDGERPETRFDIVTVYELPGQPRAIQWIPAAFFWSESGQREG